MHKTGALGAGPLVDGWKGTSISVKVEADDNGETKSREPLEGNKRDKL
jgi:hypothetical protein